MSRTIFIFCLTLLADTGYLKAKDEPRDRSTLRGLMAFNVVVDDTEPALQDRGLTANAVETEIEQRLSKAGVTVDKNSYEFIGVQIIAAHGKKTDFALCISLAVYQAVSLKRQPTITGATPTWSVENVLLVPPRQFREAWVDTIDQLVAQFIRAWHEGNELKGGNKSVRVDQYAADHPLFHVRQIGLQGSRESICLVPVAPAGSCHSCPRRRHRETLRDSVSALQETGHVALARVGMYCREHVVIVRPGKYGDARAHDVLVDEIRSESEFRTDGATVGAKELELAKTFLGPLAAPFAPEEFKDKYRAELEAMIAKKAAHVGPAPAREPSPVGKPVVDIMEALRRSLEMVRKPPASVKAEKPGKAAKDRRSGH